MTNIATTSMYPVMELSPIKLEFDSNVGFQCFGIITNSFQGIHLFHSISSTKFVDLKSIGNKIGTGYPHLICYRLKFFLWHGMIGKFDKQTKKTLFSFHVSVFKSAFKLLIDSRTICMWALYYWIYLSVGSLGSIRWNFRKLPPRFFRRSSGLVGVDDDDDEGKDEPGILSIALLLLLFMNVSGTWHCKWKCICFEKWSFHHHEFIRQREVQLSVSQNTS